MCVCVCVFSLSLSLCPLPINTMETPTFGKKLTINLCNIACNIIMIIAGMRHDYRSNIQTIVMVSGDGDGFSCGV